MSADDSAPAPAAEPPVQPPVQQGPKTPPPSDLANSDPEYIVVQDGDAGEPMELPANPEDGSLGLSTLTHAFPGAHGVKFKNPKTGASRALLVDATGTRFMRPADGWEGKVLHVIFPAKPAGGAGDGTSRRRKVDDGDDSFEEMKQQKLEPNRPVDLIVLGVNFKTGDKEFREYFEQFGKVVVADLKKDAEGNSKGFGFVQMDTLEEQDRVLAACPHMIEGRRCDVKIPDQRGPDMSGMYGGGGGGGAGRPPISKIFVGRIPDGITQLELRSFFEAEALKINRECTITDVFIPHPFRGFGFITFSQAAVAAQICKVNNFVIKGASISVSLAVPRAEQVAASDTPYGYGGPHGMHGGHQYGGMAAGYMGMAGKVGDYGQYAAYQSMYPGYPGYPAAGAGGTWERPAGSSPNRMAAGRGSKVVSPLMPPSIAPPSLATAASLAPPSLASQLATPSSQAALASGLDALNLNQRNPEVLTAAWSAFFSTLQQHTPNASAPSNGGGW